MNALPTLYKRTSTGAIQTWTIAVDGNTIITTYGQLNGKMQTAVDVIAEGKNLGKSNATTAQEQALSETLSQWEGKRKKHYQTDLDAVRAGTVDTSVIAGGVIPMLAHVYEKQKAKVVYPAFTQPKFDGHRCIAVIDHDGKATLWSRTQKPITGLPHIIRTLEAMYLADIIFDGELYNHDYKDRFEELTSFIRSPSAKPGCEAVQYHVYDIVEEAMTFAQRNEDLSYLVGNFPLLDTVQFVFSSIVNDESDMLDVFGIYLDQGYEGLMIRNAAGKYVHKRSTDLLKVKSMLDNEFEIVGVESGRGKMSNLGVFVCSTASGETFKVKMKGALSDLQQYLDRPEDYIGRMLTVQYQDLTAYGIPRFPVGLRLQTAL